MVVEDLTVRHWKHRLLRHGDLAESWGYDDPLH